MQEHALNIPSIHSPVTVSEKKAWLKIWMDAILRQNPADGCIKKCEHHQSAD